MSDDRSQGRAAQEKAQRRRRGDEALSASQRLPIPPEAQAWADANNMHLRWVNDEGNRMHRFTVQDDYDKVEGVDPVPVAVGKDSVMAHLLAKPKDFVRDDQERSDRKRQQTEEALFRSADAADAASTSANPNPARSERYVTKDTQIRRNQVSEG